MRERKHLLAFVGRDGLYQIRELYRSAEKGGGLRARDGRFIDARGSTAIVAPHERYESVRVGNVSLYTVEANEEELVAYRDGVVFGSLEGKLYDRLMGLHDEFGDDVEVVVESRLECVADRLRGRYSVLVEDETGLRKI
jgi:hypothetical protein